MRRQEKAITLIALVITIIVLIILAVVSINLILGEGGIIQRTIEADEEYRAGQAKEKLMLALSDAQIEKEYNKSYNKYEYLDEYLESRIEGAKVQGDTIIVDGYVFEINRETGEVGEYIGNTENLVFPKLEVEVKVAEDFRTATVTINAEEGTNGITKIEVLQAGYVLKEFTYEDIKEGITAEYTIKQNGKYTIKVYGELATTEVIEVEGLVEAVTYTPNGNAEYKKEHSVKVEAKEDIEKVKNIKYQWLQTTAEPAEDTFTDTCNNKDTITKSGLTGQWYLWTLLETESGKTSIGRSEAFNFDNQGPEVSLTSSPVSETSFTLTATATDALIGEISKYEFYVNNTLEKTIETKEETATYDVTVTSMGNVSCYVIVTDKLGNTTKQTITARTTMYAWEKYSVKETTSSYTKVVSSVKTNCTIKRWQYYCVLSPSYVTFCTTNGSFFNKKTPSRLYGEDCTGCVIWGTGTSKTSINIINSQSINTNNVNNMIAKVTTYKGQANITYSQGTTNHGVVYSTNGSAYPTNGKSGSYWYVYKGIE